MAKKGKKGLAAYKRTKKNTEIVSRSKTNPPAAKDLMEFVVPGFAGYAGTRLVSRVVHGMVIQRFPKFAKHASVLSTGAAAFAAWMLVHRVESIKQYHTPVVVGSSIAAIQTVVQAYLPKYGWMVSDHNLKATSVVEASQSPARLTSSAKSYSGASNELPPPIASLSPAEITEELDDLDMGSLSGGFDGGFSDDDLDDLVDESQLN